MATKTPTKPKKVSIVVRAKRDPKLLTKALANPGLRSKLPTSMLTPKLAAQRALNARLAQPVVPGSTMTERQLAQAANAATTTKYGALETQQGQALADEKQRQTDLGNFYQQYLGQLAQHTANINAIGQQAVNAGTGLMQGITGLSTQNLTALQQPANADAAARGATAGDLSGLASNAAAIRQALVGSFVANQAATNAANNTAADTTQRVVAPGQRLTAQNQQQANILKARQNITSTAREEGAYKQSYKDTARSDEAKNVLAQQTLAGKEATAADAAKATKQKAYGPGGTGMNKYGYTYDEWKGLSDKQKGDARHPPKAPGVDPVYTSGAFNGKKHSEVSAMSDAERQQYVDRYNASQGKKPGADKKTTGKGPDWLTTNEANSGLTQLGGLKNMAKWAREGTKFEPNPGDKPGTGTKLDEAGSRTKIQNYLAGKLKSPALLDAALDAVWNHYLSNTTVKALIDAGYKPSVVARTLGVQTSGQIGPKGKTTYGGPH